MTKHPAWCEPSRCSYGIDSGFGSQHRSAVIRGEYDRASGNSADIWLWSAVAGITYIHFEFPGTHNEGVDLTQGQAMEMTRTISALSMLVEAPCL